MTRASNMTIKLRYQIYFKALFTHSDHQIFINGRVIQSYTRTEKMCPIEMNFQSTWICNIKKHLSGILNPRDGFETIAQLVSTVRSTR